jgi:hypothetical protein
VLIFRDLTINANASEYFAIEGNYLTVVSSSYRGEIIVKTQRGDSFSLYVGDEIYLEDFKNLIFSHASALPIKLRVGVSGSGERYKTSRVFGEVSVINGELGRVQDGRAFAGCAFCGASANTSLSQIFNPVGSGKVLVVNRVSVVSSVAGMFSINYYDTLAVNVCVNQPLSKKSGGAGALSLFRFDSSLAANVGNVLQLLSLDSPNKQGDVLTAGKGLVVQTVALNAALWANFQFSEYDA